MVRRYGVPVLRIYTVKHVSVGVVVKEVSTIANRHSALNLHSHVIILHNII